MLFRSADLPEVRQEIAEYMSSARRCDDTVGALLDVLWESGAQERTLVIFLSDNGMAFPFAKANCYLHSTRTPWIVRWPGVVRAGAVDAEHLISGIDLLPTVLEAASIEAPAGLDGVTLMPLLRGEKQSFREHVFTQFHQTAGRRNYPMRCVQSRRFGYIFNAWSNGLREFRNEAQAGRTMAALRRSSEDDPAVAARVELFLHRVPEELYDFNNDPGALHNLVDDPACVTELARLRGLLCDWMQRTGDPMLATFERRADVAAREQFMAVTAATLGGQ